MVYAQNHFEYYKISCLNLFLDLIIGILTLISAAHAFFVM